MLAAVARIIAPFLDVGYLPAIDFAGAAWVIAFVLFVINYLPLFIRP